MLVLLLRIIFVILSVFIGLGSGQYFYRDLGLDTWFGGAIGFGIAVTLIAAEQGFRRHFTRSLVAFIIGLGLGLMLSFLCLAVLGQVIQSEELRRNIDVPIALVVTYLVMITVIRGADRFRVVIPFVEFRTERGDDGAVILGPEAVGDPRLMGLITSGVITQRLHLHRQVLTRLENQAISDDPAEAARGKRGLDALTELRKLQRPTLLIDETELPNTDNLSEALISLCRLENARIVCADAELARMARAEGLAVIDLQVLALSFSHQIRPGDVIQVKVVKQGENKDQGIGYLDDGSMVVIGKAGETMGQTVAATILRLHPTANGRMIFADRS